MAPVSPGSTPPIVSTLGTDWGTRRIDYPPQRPAMPSVLFKLSTGDWYSREVESEDAAVKQVKSLFDRHDEYLRDWIRVDGNAWIARNAVVAGEVREEPAPESAIGYLDAVAGRRGLSNSPRDPAASPAAN